MEMTKSSGEVRKANRINEYSNTRRPIYAHNVLSLSGSGHDRYDSVGGSALRVRLTDAAERTRFLFALFDARFSAAFDFRGFFFRNCSRLQHTVTLYSQA